MGKHQEAPVCLPSRQAAPILTKRKPAAVRATIPMKPKCGSTMFVSRSSAAKASPTACTSMGKCVVAVRRCPAGATARSMAKRYRALSSPLVFPLSQRAQNATGIIARSTENPQFWDLLLSEPSVKDFLCLSLMTRAEQDLSFASLVVGTAAPLQELQLEGPGAAAPTGSEFAQDNEQLPEIAAGPGDEPLLRRRRARVNSVSGVGRVPQGLGAGSIRSEPAAVICSVGDLTSVVLAEVFAFVDVKTKVRALLPASRHTQQAMQCRSAWDPLCLDQATCRNLLRTLKKYDPIGCFAADVARTKSFFPDDFFDVHRLQVALMDPERVQQVQSDTESEEPKPRELAIADPLDEMCKRLRHYFPAVKELQISNIEDFRMDYRFLGMRSGSLSSFSFVELAHCDTNSTTTYSLLARCSAPPRLVDTVRAVSENKSRMPAGVFMDAGTTLSEREALYLAEHQSAYKNGDNFHFKHAVFRTVQSHMVRKKYKGIVASLRERFPHQFPKVVDPCSPESPRRLARSS